MRTVQGGPWGIDQAAEAITIDTIGNNNYIRVATAAWLYIFQHAAIIEGDITNDTLGLYSRLLVDGEGKAKFGHWKTPHHLFRPRQNGCAWNPNGALRMGLTEFDTCPIEYQGEQCPDVYWNSCFEKLFTEGRGHRDLQGSPELRELLVQALQQLSIGMGNSFHELVWFSAHPDIEAADTAGSFAVDEERWDAFYAQMVGPDSRPNNCSGLLTIMDGLADEGEPGYDIDIPSSDIDDNNNYTGDIVALINKLINRAKPELRTMARRGIGSGANKRFPIILLTEPEFRAYGEHVETNFPNIPSMLQFFLTGSDGTGQLMPGVYHYKGIPIVSWDASTSFDEIVGTNRHRAALVAPGTFGVASDVRDLRQYQGMGLRMVQKLDPPDNGKIYMDTTLRWGAALADKDFVVYARNPA